MRQLSEQQRATMADDGYVIVEGALTDDECDRFSKVLDELWFSEGLCESHNFDAGVQFVPNLLQYSADFELCVANEVILEAVRVALGPSIRLNRLQSRRADPGGGHQPLPLELQVSRSSNSQQTHVDDASLAIPEPREAR